MSVGSRVQTWRQCVNVIFRHYGGDAQLLRQLKKSVGCSSNEICCLRCQQGSFCGWLVVSAMSAAVRCMLLNRPCEHGGLTAIVACRLDVLCAWPPLSVSFDRSALGPHFRSLLNSLLISIYQYVSWSFQISDTHVAAQLQNLPFWGEG